MFHTDSVSLYHGRCGDILPTLAENSFDSVVCDPPYGLSKEPNMAEVLTHWLAGDDYQATGGGFMGKTWDSFVPGPATWREVLRVLKPGGYALVFAGSRTVDLMAVSLRLAGFEIRDQIQWIYGSGFPKSLDIGKTIEERQGWGTALKPAHEPIIVARKPLAEGTVAANVLKWGTGGLNIDGCRVEGAPEPTRFNPAKHGHEGWRMSATGADTAANASPLGRFPANIIHDGSDEVLACFPEAPGQMADASTSSETRKNQNCYGDMARGNAGAIARIEADKSAARFFYCAKASKSDRGGGNTHPTVKPQALMRYLCKLITPPNGKVLDPFAGSGSTGVSAKAEGFHPTLVEMDAAYIGIIKSRLGIVDTPQPKCDAGPSWLNPFGG